MHVIVLCVGESKAPLVLYLSHSTVYVEARANTARHMITVILLAFLTQENKASKIHSTINQLKHGKGRAIRNNGTRSVVSIDQYSTRIAISTTPLVPLLHVQHFLPCLNYYV